jgi:hypothetical protein
MTRTNFVLFVATALMLCVLLAVKASLRHATPAPTPVVTAPKATTVVPIKPAPKMVPAPAVAVPLAIEPRNLTIVPVKPAPVVSSQPMSANRPRLGAAPAPPRAGGKGSPDGQ